MITKETLDTRIASAEESLYSIDSIIYDDDKYSRKNVDNTAVMDYSKNLAALPPIIINQDNIIVDGVHRYLAAKKNEQNQIRAKRIFLEANEIKLANLLCDVTSGVRHPESDIARICREYWSPDPEANKNLYTELGISQQRFSEFTSDLARERKKEINEQIAYALLNPTWTQTEIATRFGYKNNTPISKVKDDVLFHLPDSGKQNKDGVLSSDFAFLADRYDWQPDLYNIWNKASGDADNDHFGHFPQHFLRNLLYYHTHPFDTVYDPFAGGGTVIDACRFMMRKYIATDRKPMGHRPEIGQWDIADGLPEWLPRVDLAFLDPPYWKQAENKYSEDAEDLANMTIDQFNDMMNGLLINLRKHKVTRIAIVISPTQWKNDDKRFIPHITDFNNMLDKHYETEMHYVLPYSSQQYNGNQVNMAKEMKLPLNVIRYLWVWRRIK